MANILFAECSRSTYEEALDAYTKAYEYDNKWIENILAIAETCVKLKQISEAKKWINEGLARKVEGESEQIAHEKLVKLKEKYN